VGEDRHALGDRAVEGRGVDLGVHLAGLPRGDGLVVVDHGAATGRPHLGDFEREVAFVADHEVMDDFLALRHDTEILDRLDGHGLGLAGLGQQRGRDEHYGAKCQNGGLEMTIHDGLLLYQQSLTTREWYTRRSDPRSSTT